MQRRICKGTEIRTCLVVLNILTLMSLWVLMMHVQNQNNTFKDPSLTRGNSHFEKIQLNVKRLKKTFSRTESSKDGVHDVRFASMGTKLLPSNNKKPKTNLARETANNVTEYRTFMAKSRNKGPLFNSNLSDGPFAKSNDIANHEWNRTDTFLQVKMINEKTPRPHQAFRKSGYEAHRVDQHTTTFKLNTKKGFELKIELERNHLTPVPSIKAPKDLDSALLEETMDKETNIPSNHEGFHEVGDESHAYVFSAIYDDVTVPVIRVITLVRDFNNLTIRCCYGNNGSESYSGTLQYIPEPDWGYSYRSAFILCQVPKNQLPTEVAIITAGERQIKSTLRVIYPLKKRWRIIKCFSVLHSNFNNTIQLIQQIEISLLFGVEHFVTYIRDVNDSVMTVLHMYEKLGLLDIIPWNLPLKNIEIHYHGQLAVLQECLYRHLHVTDYILTGDTDELFVPKMNISVLETIKENLKDRSYCSALVLRQSFFPLNLPPYSGSFPAKPEVQKLKLTFLLQTTHLKVLDPDERSKLIVKPTGVEILGIHTVLKFRGGQGGCVCPSNYCLLNHYREIPKQDLGSFRITDTFLHNYSEIIVGRVKKRLKNLTIT